jgi:hypothetical protein
MNHIFSNLLAKLCLVLALAVAGSGRAEEELPSQDQALAGALENHPEIVAAKAKVALVNAELYGKRIEVSRQVIGLYGSLKKLELQIGVAKAALQELKQASENGGAGDPEWKNSLKGKVQTAEAELAQAVSQREQAERELRLLIGKVAPPISGDSGERLGLAAPATGVPRQAPKGPIVDQMRVALEKPLKLDFVDTPLKDVMGYLANNTGITFSLQKTALENVNTGPDEPITLLTKEVSLQAAIEAFQDAYPDLQFVLRDYGVLVTEKEYAKEHGYTPVLELEKQVGAASKER